MVAGKCAYRASLSAAYHRKLGEAWGAAVSLACARQGGRKLCRGWLPCPRDLHVHNAAAAALETVCAVLPRPEGALEYQISQEGQPQPIFKKVESSPTPQRAGMHGRVESLGQEASTM